MNTEGFKPPEVFGALRLIAIVDLFGSAALIFLGASRPDGADSSMISSGAVGLASAVIIFALAEMVRQQARAAFFAEQSTDHLGRISGVLDESKKELLRLNSQIAAQSDQRKDGGVARYVLMLEGRPRGPFTETQIRDLYAKGSLQSGTQLTDEVRRRTVTVEDLL